MTALQYVSQSRLPPSAKSFITPFASSIDKGVRLLHRHAYGVISTSGALIAAYANSEKPAPLPSLPLIYGAIAPFAAIHYTRDWAFQSSIENNDLESLKVMVKDGYSATSEDVIKAAEKKTEVSEIITASFLEDKDDSFFPSIFRQFGENDAALILKGIAKTEFAEKALTTQDELGKTLLHYVFEQEQSIFPHGMVHAANEILTNFSDSVLSKALDIRDNSGENFLFKAILSNINIAKTIIHKFPEKELDIQNKEGETPLHSLLDGTIKDLNKILEIIDLHSPRALMIQDKNGDTPLHSFAKAHKLDPTSEEIGIKLVEKVAQMPKGLSVQNGEGDTPLHLIIANARHPENTNTAIEVIKLLSIEELMIKNSKGKTPVDLAFESPCPDKIVLALIEKIANRPIDPSIPIDRYLQKAISSRRSEIALALVHKLPNDLNPTYLECLNTALSFRNNDVSIALINKLSNEVFLQKNQMLPFLNKVVVNEMPTVLSALIHRLPEGLDEPYLDFLKNLITRRDLDQSAIGLINKLSNEIFSQRNQILPLLKYAMHHGKSTVLSALIRRLPEGLDESYPESRNESYLGFLNNLITRRELAESAIGLINKFSNLDCLDLHDFIDRAITFSLPTIGVALIGKASENLGFSSIHLLERAIESKQAEIAIALINKLPDEILNTPPDLGRSSPLQLAERHGLSDVADLIRSKLPQNPSIAAQPEERHGLSVVEDPNRSRLPQTPSRAARPERHGRSSVVEDLIRSRQRPQNPSATAQLERYGLLSDDVADLIGSRPPQNPSRAGQPDDMEWNPTN